MLNSPLQCRSVLRVISRSSSHKASSHFISPRSTYALKSKFSPHHSCSFLTRPFSSSILTLASPTSSPPSSQDPLEDESQKLIDSASLLLEKGDIEGAKDLYEKSISIKPTSTSYYNLGITLYQLKKLPEAIKVWETSLNLNPSSDVHTNLASAYILSEPPQPQKALYHLKQAVELDPTDGEIRFNLAAVNEANNHLQDALAEYQHARRLGIKRADQNIRNVGAKLLRKRLQEEQNAEKGKN